MVTNVVFQRSNNQNNAANVAPVAAGRGARGGRGRGRGGAGRGRQAQGAAPPANVVPIRLVGVQGLGGRLRDLAAARGVGVSWCLIPYSFRQYHVGNIGVQRGLDLVRFCNSIFKSPLETVKF